MANHAPSHSEAGIHGIARSVPAAQVHIHSKVGDWQLLIDLIADLASPSYSDTIGLALPTP